jgi:hypothetical protein
MPSRRPFRTAISRFAGGSALQGGCRTSDGSDQEAAAIVTHSPAGSRQFAESEADVLGWAMGYSVSVDYRIAPALKDGKAER